MRRLGIILLVLLVVTAAGFAAWLRSDLRTLYKGYSQDKVFVNIPHGKSRRAIAALLEQNGVVHSRVTFELLSRWRELEPLEAGEYLFDRPMTPREVFTMIATGRIYVHSITVPEGWTMFDIADALDREGLCHRNDFLAAVRDPSPVRDIAPDARSLEGFLFPATYDFTRHTTPQEIVDTMVHRFRTVLAGLPGVSHDAEGNVTGLPAGFTLKQVVTMASLVERETARPDERSLVVGVFYNRLQGQRPLQCDPTVLYALALAGRPERALSSADLRINSPYNTYQHAGLPPGPIANPGEGALRAALTPSRVPYFYFVATGDGGHAFGRTLAEHNLNVARYRRRLAQEADGSTADEPQQPAPPAPVPPMPVQKKKARKRS